MAFNWACSKNNPEDDLLGLRLFNGLGRYWNARGLQNEGLAWGRGMLDRLTAPDAGAIEIRALACFNMGNLLGSLRSGELEEWRGYLEESVALYRNTSNRNRLALALATLWEFLVLIHFYDPDKIVFDEHAVQAMCDESLAVAQAIGSHDPPDDRWIKAGVLRIVGNWFGKENLPMVEEAYALFHELGDLVGETWGLFSLGSIINTNGDPVLARSYVLRGLELARLLGDQDRLRGGLGTLGPILYELHDFVEMETCFFQVENLTVETSSEHPFVWPQRMRAIAVLHQGDLSRSYALFSENLSITSRTDDPSGVLSNILGIGGVAAHSGEYEKGLQLMSFFDHQMETFFKPPDPVDQKEFEWHLSILREKLDPAAFSSSWEQGRALTLDQALAIAEAIEGQVAEKGIPL